MATQAPEGLGAAPRVAVFGPHPLFGATIERRGLLDLLDGVKLEKLPPRSKEADQRLERLLPPPP